MLAAPTTGSCLGGNSDPMHLPNLRLQSFCHHLMLFHQSDSTKVRSLNKDLEGSSGGDFESRNHLKHAAAATTDVDNSNVGGIGKGLCEGRNY